MGPGYGEPWEGAQDPTTRLPEEPGRDQEEAVEALLQAEALAQAEALVRADQEGVTPQDLLALADRAVRMAGGMREHIVAGSLLDAWAAADWLGDLAQEVKDRLPVSSSDILAAVEGDTLPPRQAVAWPPSPAEADAMFRSWKRHDRGSQ